MTSKQQERHVISPKDFGNHYVIPRDVGIGAGWKEKVVELAVSGRRFGLLPFAFMHAVPLEVVNAGDFWPHFIGGRVTGGEEGKALGELLEVTKSPDTDRVINAVCGEQPARADAGHPQERAIRQTGPGREGRNPYAGLLGWLRR